MKVLLIIGSKREKSFNRKLSLFAKEYLEENGVSCSFLNFENLPFFSEDLENPELESIKTIRGEIKEADALWFFSPEYNHSYPGYLKNLIDWLSRKCGSESAISGKICAISGIGGRGKTGEALKKLTELLSFVQAEVITPAEGFAANPEAFKGEDLSVSLEDIGRLKNEADSLIRRLS